MGRPRTLLQVLVEARRQTYEEFLADFAATARELGLSHTLSMRQFCRWLAGEVDQPTPGACRVLEHMFGRPVEDLLGPPPPQAVAVRAHSAGIAAPDWGWDDGTSNEPPGAPLAADTKRELVMAAAHQSGDHAMDALSAVVHPASLDDLRTDIVRLARAYHATPPVRLLGEALRLRNQVYRLLERTRRPAQAADLYMVAGQACGLMASASFDLGFPDAAAEQARAAYSYADLVGHDGLRAWSRGVQAEAAYWTGRPREALDLVDVALDYARPGSSTVRLRCIQGRAWAYLDARDEATASIEAAERARESDTEADDLHDQVGGHFSFDLARQARCNATALVQLGAADDAAEEAARAVELYESSDGAWRLVELEVRADLASSYLLRGDLEAAGAALTGLWALPPEQRREGLTDRIGRTRSLLARPALRNTPVADHLADQIEDFISASVVRALGAAPSTR